MRKYMDYYWGNFEDATNVFRAYPF